MNTIYDTFDTKFKGFIGVNYAPFEKMGFVYVPKQCVDNHISCAFSLDFSLKTIESAIQEGVNIIMCFHCPDELNPDDPYNASIITLLESNKIALYKCHLPLNFADNGIHKKISDLLRVSASPLDFLYDKDFVRGGVYRINGEYVLSDIIKMFDGFSLENISIYNKKEFNHIYKKIVYSSGSGCKKEMLDQIDCDLFITGEVKHGLIVRTADLNICLIGIGHYESEAEPLRLIMEDFSSYSNIPCHFLGKYFSQSFISSYGK